ncbi:MAG: PEP-utilizing enzyme [Mycobacterium kyogaense]|uniref:PEP/pyruvate-binding domain-containing protein n=1 Tax=Mycobacterium kyogaense TaxID=2212479 RepID=UPI002FF9B4E4
MNSADCVADLQARIDHPALAEIEWDQLLATSPGCEHVRTENFASLARGVIAVSRDRPSVFDDLGRHYESLGHQWLAWLESLDSTDLGGVSDNELAELVDVFASYYQNYATILWLPFILEFRYAQDYPALVTKIAKQIGSKDGAMGDLHAIASECVDFNLAVDAQKSEDFVRSVLDRSPRRTMSEEKDDAFRQTARWIVASDSPAYAMFMQGSSLPNHGMIERIDPDLAARLVDLHRKYAWLSHWGYPPRFREATFDEVVAEIATYVNAAKIGDAHDVRDYQFLYDAILASDVISDGDKQLIRDTNYYTFLRTYRMELKIRAQYLSIPLFAEVDRRGVQRGHFSPYDVYNMVPPEISTFLRTAAIPPNLSERRDGWALRTSALDKSWQVMAGNDFANFSDEFLGVIFPDDNARGVHNITAEYVGGKALNLIRLLKAGVNTPPFFVATTYGFDRFIHSNQLQGLWALSLESVVRSDEATESVAEKARQRLLAGEIPPKLCDGLLTAADRLPFDKVAVRSSATVEDAENLSWAGRFSSVVPAKKSDLLAAVKSVWASTYSAPALRYAAHAGLETSTPVQMAVIVQGIVPADVSGVINTITDIERPSLIEIEAIWGLGAPLVDGSITPDRYIVDAAQKGVVEHFPATQLRQLGTDGWTGIAPMQAGERKLSDAQLLELAVIGKRIETSFGRGQDIEFAYANGELFILQTRPLTGTTQFSVDPRAVDEQRPRGRNLISGMKGGTNTVHVARAQVVRDLSESASFESGNILVIHAATPAWDSVIFRSSGLITNEGGATSHAIRVAKERSIPAVVGTETGTDVIVDGALIMIDTASDPFVGRVFES